MSAAASPAMVSVAAPSPAPVTSSQSQYRPSLHSLVCAISGAVFVALTAESVLGALIWALGQTLHLPGPLVDGVGLLTLIAAVVGALLLARHALEIERCERASPPA